MDGLVLKTSLGFLRLLLIMTLMIFGSAWSLDFVQGWIYIAIFFSSVLLLTLFLLKTDRLLLESRLKVGPKSETREKQKIIQSVASLFAIGTVLFPGLDYRFRWSHIPLMVSLFGYVFLVLGFAVIFSVFRTNKFSSAVVEVRKDQKVVSSGVYSIVRHPMYFGALLVFVSTPFCLGSLLGILFAVPMVIVLALRISDEETLLEDQLVGYNEYKAKVKYKLLPFIW